ncbi:hypothetical protein V5N11_003864 [Cardamine amara subsp. amara]|uniref:Uncharacterized protein n=1 Tax=Cardamine amara subsp. amara TaxID=228776 RepID=A0ABD1A3F8_CARAN
MATMGLPNFIRISNFSDEDFAEIIEQIVFENTEDETNLGDTEATEIVEGDHMMYIREQIADMLWEN